MKFLHINNESEISQLNNSVKANKQVFLLIYMEGCGPCNETLPEWKKIENILNGKINEKKYNNVVIAEIEKDNLNKLTFIKDDIKGFPSMKYISNNGSLQEDFEDSNIKNKSREIDAFMEWIDSKLKADKYHKGQKSQKGGKWSRKYKRSINCRRPRGFSQKNYCKYGRKTKKTRTTYK
jgi:thiol-disulfide isomerase/thioredoxin